MKIKLLVPELNLTIGDQTSSTGGTVQSVKILKKNNFVILQAFGVFLETDIIVSGLTASYGTFTDKIDLNWIAVDGVTFYRVYKNKNEFVTETTSTSYTDTDQSPGTVVTYAVKTAVFNQGLTYISKSVYANGWRKLIPPVLTGQVDVENNIVTLNWSSANGATAYKIYKTQGTDTANLNLFGITTSNSITDKKIAFSKTYTYAIKSSCILGDSEYSNPQTFTVIGDIPDSPTNVTASTGNYYDKVIINWNAANKATFYNVYKDSESIKIGSNITGLSFADNSATPETTHQYYVSAQNINGETAKIPSNLGWKRISIPTGINATDGVFNSNVFVSWDGVDGATGYKVFKGSPLQEYQTVTGTTLQDTAVTYGNTYAYAVKSVGTLTQSELSGTDIGFVSQSVPETAPTGVSASDGAFTDKIAVTWNSVSSIQGVSGYNVYKNQQLIGQTINTEFNDISVVNPGITFEYAVRAFNSAGQGITSAENTGWLKLSPPQNIIASTNQVDRINLNWSVVNGATGYKVFTGSNFSPETNVVLLGITTNTDFSDFTPTFGQNYKYAIKASCVLGDSDYSATAIGSVIQSPPETAPTGISASDGAFTDKVVIEWNPVVSIQGISGYNVFKDSVLLTTTNTTNTTDTILTPGTIAEYTVNAFNLAGNGPTSSGNTGWIGLTFAQNFSASKSASFTQIFLNWSQVNGATAYKVFKGTPSSLVFLDQTPNTSYTDSGLATGVTFAYAVKASCVLGDSTFSSIDIGETGTPVALPDPPSGISASDGAFADKVTITWNTVSGISGYVVFRNALEIGRTNAELFNDTPIPGTTFNYGVASRNTAGVGTLSTTDTGWRGLTAPSTITATTTLPDRVNLNWSAVSGATAYKIFTGSSFSPSDTSVQLIGITTFFSFSDFTPTFGVGYTYAIKASCPLGDSEYSSRVRGSVIQVAPETAPTGVSASDGAFTNKIVVNWNPVTSIQGVSGYKIFKNEIFTSQTTGISFTDTTPVQGQTFDYKVRAFNRAGDGPLSAGNTGWAKLNSPQFLIASTDLTDKINLIWPVIAAATQYKIFTGTGFSPPTNVNLIGTVNSPLTEFNHIGPTYGVQYNYAVKASCPLGDSDFSDSATGAIAQSPPDAVPTGVVATDGTANNKVTITWTPPVTIMGVSGYKVYKTAPNGSETQQTTTTIPFEDFTGTPGFTFEYKVSAVNLAGEGQKSSGDLGWKGLSAPTQFLATDGAHQDKVALSWNSIHGSGVSYKVYRGTPLSLLGITSNTTFNDTTASPGTTLQYAVSAFTSTAIESTFSNTDIGFVGLTAPSGLSASLGTLTDKIRVSWSPVTGAPLYRVYKDTTTNLIATTGLTGHDDTITTPGITANYFVSSFIPDVAFESVKSAGVSGRRKISAPTGLTATKGTFADKVVVGWNSVLGANTYKVFRGISFAPETGVTLIGTVSAPTTTFNDVNATGGALYYAAKASCPVEDSDYSNTEIGYVDNLYSEVLTLTQQVQDRYKEKVGDLVTGTYQSAPPRLPKWTGPLFWNPKNLKEVVEGITAIGAVSGITKGWNIYDNPIQTAYILGVRGGGTDNNSLGSTFEYIERIVRKYDPGAWWVNLNGTKGLTLRGGTANYYIRQYSFNNMAANPYPDYTVENDVWVNPRNKLLYNMYKISEQQINNGAIFDNLETLALSWRFRAASSAGMTSDRAANSFAYKPELDSRIQSQDYLSVIKTILSEIKNHYPLAIPQNELTNNSGGWNSKSTWFKEYNTGGRYLGMSGGSRVISTTIGATFDNIPGMGITSTWSPGGLTADQGEYLVDAWKRRHLVNTMYLLQGITTAINPEGISGGQLLTQDASWNTLFKQLRTLLFKELRDHVKHTWERRAWYMGVDSGGGRDSEFSGDIDNIGWIQGNQWLEPLSSVIQIAMYLYPFAENDMERQALLAAYNMCTENLAAHIERALWVGTDPDKAGIWTEGYGYASQSYPTVLKILDDMRRMGDRRLWDTVSKRGSGITYSAWINNAWKWSLSRQMPGLAVTNYGSCDSSDYSGGIGNGYHIYGWPHEHFAVLASESPSPGTTGSAISNLYNVWKKVSGCAFRGWNNTAYELKKYHENVVNKSARTFSKGNYFPDDQTFTWVSEFIIPWLQDERIDSKGFGRGFNFETNSSVILTQKPLIFGIWGKGSFKFEGKGHRDEGHISAYLGDAPILIEVGEQRADESTARRFFEKEQTGHNIMQLGGYRKHNWPRPAIITGVTLGETGGSLFMDTTAAYNTRSLTAAPTYFGGYVHQRGGLTFPWGFDPDNGEAEYQYQIRKVTRGITWSYDPNYTTATIKVQDIVGISGICGGASGPSTRVYYRWHTGFTGAATVPDELEVYPVEGTNNRTWNVYWNTPIPYNVNSYGFTCSHVNTNMIISGSQPLNITKTLGSHFSTRDAVRAANFADQTKHFMLDIGLGQSGGVFHDERNLTVNTEIRSEAVTRTPIYAAYWEEWNGCTLLSHMTPIVWVNGITQISAVPFSVNQTLQATTPIQGFTAVANKFKGISAGKRVLGTYRYHFKEAFLGSTFDTVGLGLTYSPWFDNGIQQVQAEWQPWLNGLVANGGTFDYWAFDNESAHTSFTNWSIPGLTNAINPTSAQVLRAITSDARFTQSKHGITALSVMLQGVDLDKVLSGAGSPNNEYLAWNNALNTLGVAGLNRALWNYTSEKIPGVRGSNYDCVINPNNPGPDLNGHQQPRSAIFGTAASPVLYGEVQGAATSWWISDTNPTKLTLTTQTQRLTPNSPWTGFLLDQQMSRSSKRSSVHTRLQPWISGFGFTGSGSSTTYITDRRYFYENVAHTILLGAELILLWNGMDNTLSSAERTANGITLNNWLVDVNQRTGGMVRKTSISGITSVSFKATYITTGAKIYDNKYVWRTTFRPDITKAKNNITGIFYDLGGLTCGLWDGTTTDNAPTYTAITEMPLIRNYATYTKGSSTTNTSTTGCSTQFAAPTYTFPSWDVDISKTPGISFGRIQIADFMYLTARGETGSPNTLILPC